MATPLSARQLKAAQQALRYYQAIDEVLGEVGLVTETSKEPWRALVALVVNATRDNPELGSTLLPMTRKPSKTNANELKGTSQPWGMFLGTFRGEAIVWKARGGPWEIVP